MDIDRALDSNALPSGSGGLLLAFSGGLDSSVLLHALAAAPRARARGLRVIHVDHGLQPASAEWAGHCARICAALELPFEVARVAVGQGSGGLEDRARRARYRALQAAMRPADVLITAHHLDDQAETFLLRALRGAGEKGLAGMRELRGFGRGWLWRPLLDQTREQLAAYASQHGLHWIEDPSNQALDHDRNFLRHALLPLLAQRWPQAAQALALSARRCREAEARLAQVDAIDVADVQLLDARSIDLVGLLEFERPRRARVLRAWLHQQGAGLPPDSVLAQIERELLHARGDSAAEVRWGKHRLRAWRSALHLLPTLAPWPSGHRSRWDGSTALQLPDGHLLQLCDGSGAALQGRRLSPLVEVRARTGGERIRLAPSRPSQSVKTLLQQLGVPPWQRAHLPLLWDSDGRLLAVADLLLSEEFADSLSAVGACLRWVGPYGLQREAGSNSEHDGTIP